MSRRILMIAAVLAIFLSYIDIVDAKQIQIEDEEQATTSLNKVTDAAKQAKEELKKRLEGTFMDMRGEISPFEKIASFIYLGIAFFYILFLGYAVFIYGKQVYRRWYCAEEPMTQEEIENFDNNSVSEFTVKELTKFNLTRDEGRRLDVNDLLYVWQSLQDRAEFEPDDTFSQKTAIRVYIEQIRNGDQGAALQQWEDDTDKYLKSEDINKQVNHRQYQNVYNLKNGLIALCILTYVTAFMAIFLIFKQFVSGDRLICLVEVDNSFLRILFAIIVLMICIRDLIQIRINTAIRYSGVMNSVDQSFTLYFETWVRRLVNLYAVMNMLIVIFTHPADDAEGPIDQTMNFTALVILLEIDNILGAMLEKKVSFYEVDKQFDYNAETVEKDFNKMADFILDRKEFYPCWTTFENIFNWMLTVSLFAVFLVIPVFYLSIYFIIPSKAELE